MAPARPVEQDFPPLDDELALLPGSVSPRCQDHLIRLAVWMPYARVADMLAALTGVQVSEATIRRQTYTAGTAWQAVQTVQAAAPEEPACTVPVDKLVLSAAGAMVPQVAWAVGRSQNPGDRRGSRWAGPGFCAKYAPAVFLAHE